MDFNTKYLKYKKKFKSLIGGVNSLLQNKFNRNKFELLIHFKKYIRE